MKIITYYQRHCRPTHVFHQMDRFGLTFLSWAECMVPKRCPEQFETKQQPKVSGVKKCVLLLVLKKNPQICETKNRDMTRIPFPYCSGKRGEIIAQQYSTRQNTKRSGTERSNDRSARESIRKLQQELQEITAAKEAEAMEKQLGLMKAASALDAEYERLSGKSASDIARAKLGASDLERFLIDAGVAGAQIAADTAANTLMPGSGIVLKGVRSFGDASQEARKAGASIGQQVAYGSAKAALDIGTRKIAKSVSAYGKGLADEEITKNCVPGKA